VDAKELAVSVYIISKKDHSRNLKLNPIIKVEKLNSHPPLIKDLLTTPL